VNLLIPFLLVHKVSLRFMCGRTAIQPVTSEPIISIVHPYHKIAVCTP